MGHPEKNHGERRRINRAGWSGLLFLLIFFPLKAQAAGPFEGLDPARQSSLRYEVQVAPQPGEIGPGATFVLHVQVTLAPGWHIYSLETQSRGSAGETPLATRIHLKDPPFIPRKPWRENPPQIVLDKALQRVVKTHRRIADFRREMQVPQAMKTGKYALSGEIVFRACDNKTCTLPKTIPFSTQVRVTRDTMP